MNDPRRLLFYLGIAALAAYGTRQILRQRADKQLQSATYLQAVADSLNSRGPVTLAEGLELTNIAAEEAMITYNYRFLNYDGGTVNVTALKKAALDAVCADEAARRMLTHGIGLRLGVHDKYRVQLTNVVVLPNSC